MTEAFWDLLSIGTPVAMTVMFVAWLVAKRLNNGAVVDVAWALSFAALAVVYWAFGQGDATRKLLLCSMVLVWALRLAIYLALRIVREFPREGGRHAALRAQYPRNTWFVFFAFFQLQAGVVVILSGPFAMVASNPEVGLTAWEWSGLGLWLVALLGETLADFQLQRFRAKNSDLTKVCRAGLWRFSRHPNYFFEWLIWIAFALFAIGTPDGWLAVYCPILMLFFLVDVTGIRPVETHALGLRGEAYRAYQRTTSAFIPWFPGR